MRRLATLAWAAVLVPSAEASEFDLFDPAPTLSAGRPRFRVDSGTRLGPHGPEVILGFEVPYEELFFRPDGIRYKAEFDLIMVIYRDGSQIGGDLWSEEIEVDGYAETQSRTLWIRRVVSVSAEAGEYTAEAILRESRSGRENRSSWEIDVPDYSREPLSVSSLWVADLVSTRGDSTLVLPPRGWVLSRRFGEPLEVLGVVGEVYQPDAEERVDLTWKILGDQGEEIQKGMLVLGSGARIPFQIHPDLETLWLGDHVFELTLTSGDRQARRRFAFQIAESPAAFATDLDQSLELIRLIASDDEVREIRETPSTERDEAWARFWKRRDPTPGTPENEHRDEFFARVRYVNEHFSTLGPGWQTDQGRIYIQYGPPDQIESHSYNLDGPPYEVWSYHRLGKRFVFVDYDGFGRYELYQPGRF